MSGTTSRQRALWKSGKGPDGMDIQTVMDAIYDEFRVYAEIHIYQSLVGDLIIDVSAVGTDQHGNKGYYGTHRVFTPGGPSLDALMLQCLHYTYHDLDRNVSRETTDGRRRYPPRP